MTTKRIDRRNCIFETLRGYLLTVRQLAILTDIHPRTVLRELNWLKKAGSVRSIPNSNSVHGELLYYVVNHHPFGVIVSKKYTSIICPNCDKRRRLLRGLNGYILDCQCGELRRIAL